jgi:7,8-dihydropterin-6-yl-methyl-4-(beta-D-ribofuranosyl)aminobenzene 5'-phosphate synthase
VNPDTGEAKPDTMPEDQALVIRTAKGLVVITGCAHAGVVNTALYASKMLGQKFPIYALIGGLHLFEMKVGDNQTPGTLAWTADQLSSPDLKISYLLGAHCTGLEALEYLRKVMNLPAANVYHSTISTTFGLNIGIVPQGKALNRPPKP